jgi:hypothetical protein
MLTSSGFPLWSWGIFYTVPLKRSVIFLQSWTSTSYFSNSTGSIATNFRSSPTIASLLLKVETPYHDNDLILTPIISPQSGSQWTRSCPELHMDGFSDGGWQFWDSGGVTRMELPVFNTFINFSPPSFLVASQLFLCLFWISLRLGIGVSNTLAFQNLCKIARASNTSDSNAQHFLSDSLTQSWFHSMLFALPGYQFPYTVTNRCFYLIHDCRSSIWQWPDCALYCVGVHITYIRPWHECVGNLPKAQLVVHWRAQCPKALS